MKTRLSKVLIALPGELLPWDSKESSSSSFMWPPHLELWNLKLSPRVKGSRKNGSKATDPLLPCFQRPVPKTGGPLGPAPQAERPSRSDPTGAAHSAAQLAPAEGGEGPGTGERWHSDGNVFSMDLELLAWSIGYKKVVLAVKSSEDTFLVLMILGTSSCQMTFSSLAPALPTDFTCLF